MQIAYTLPDDGIVPLKSLHRFQYDPMMCMAPCTDSVFDERWTSHDAYGFRAPNLPPSLWEHREHEGSEHADTEGRVPLYRLHHIGLVTLFMIERTLHPIKTWKRIIVTYSQ
jgi:hypothetical protein